MEKAAGRIRVVGTTSAPLMAQVDSGAFLDHLYYRLNVGMVDMTT
jgi:DNA-binding NtrC family response regulator